MIFSHFTINSFKIMEMASTLNIYFKSVSCCRKPNHKFLWPPKIHHYITQYIIPLITWNAPMPFKQSPPILLCFLKVDSTETGSQIEPLRSGRKVDLDLGCAANQPTRIARCYHKSMDPNIKRLLPEHCWINELMKILKAKGIQPGTTRVNSGQWVYVLYKRSGVS